MNKAKKPYVAPIVELDEYQSELGFAETMGSNANEFTENTGLDGQNEQGGFWDGDEVIF